MVDAVVCADAARDDVEVADSEVKLQQRGSPSAGEALFLDHVFADELRAGDFDDC